MTPGYASSTFVRLLAIALNAAGALVLLPLVLKTLGEHEFGIWAMASSITGYLLLLDLGIAMACTRYLSVENVVERKGWQRTISSAMLLSLALTALLLVAAIGLQVLLRFGVLAAIHRLLGDVVTVLLVEVAFSIPLRLYQSVLRAELRYLAIGWFENVRIVLRLTGIPAVLWLGGGLMGIVVFSSLTNVAFFALMLVSVYRRNRTLYFSWQAWDWQHLQVLFSFSKYAALSQVAEFFRYRTDTLLVGALLGLQAVAPYAILIVLLDMFTQVLMRFQGYWDTLIMREAGQGCCGAAALGTVFRSLGIGAGIAFLMVSGCGLLGSTFLGWWVGPQYMYLTPSLMLLALTLPGTAVQLAVTPCLNALGRQHTNAWLGMGETLLKVLLLVPLGHFYGYVGVIYACLLASAFATALRLHLLANLPSCQTCLTTL